MSDRNCDILEAFAADLTTAVYDIALRHATGHTWLDLELDLWRAVVETARKWGRELSPPVRPPESRAWQRS